MDDKKNAEENQPQSDVNTPQPIFDAKMQGHQQENAAQEAENLQPEEVPENIDIAHPEAISDPSQEIPENSMDEPPPVYEENKNKYLFVVVGVVVFILIFILFFRTILSGRTKTTEVKLIYWGLWEDKQVYEPLIVEYEKQHPNIKIQYERKFSDDYLQKLLVQSRDGIGPDIFRFHNTWLPQIAQVLARIPPQIMSTKEFEATFYPIHQKDLKNNNNYYGLPLEIDGLVLVVNDTLLKNAGIATPPTSWEDLLDIAATLTTKGADGQIKTSGIALGTASNVNYFSDIFGWMLLQNGGDLKKLDQPEAFDTLKSYREFAELPNNLWDEDMPSSINAFIQEKVAMIFVPSWEVLNIKASNPDLKIKVLPLPKVPGTKPISIASYWVEGVSINSKNQIEAWKFLKYLTEKENMTKLYERESQLRLFGEPYSRVDLGSLLVQNEYLGAVIQQANNFETLPLAANTHDNGLNDQLIKYIENAINDSLRNGVAYDESMKTAAQGVSQVFSKYKIE